MNRTKACIILFAGLFVLAQSAYGMGLSTNFGRVKVDNLKAGQAYSMEKDNHTPLIISNTSDTELELKVDVVIPQAGELVEGYEAIPDTGWISVAKTGFILAPNSDASTDVVITIPDSEEYMGKKYQVYIWSHTENSALGIGLKSKLLISIAK